VGFFITSLFAVSGFFIHSSVEFLLPAILIAVCAFVYFIPSFVGWNKRNADAIIALNFFLGWTFIGWVIALVWALVKDPHTEKHTINSQYEDDKLITEWTVEPQSPWQWLLRKLKKS
jgi:hypothetical protein